jgi:TorA maturation chaperone TorD
MSRSLLDASRQGVLKPVDETRSNMAASRARIYSLLGSLYLDIPDPKSIERSLGQLQASIRSEGIGMLADFFKKTENEPPQDLRNRLSVEHTKLLGGIGKGYGLPPPYESVWIGEWRIMGRSTVEVAKIYGEAGLELAADIKQPPDHVSIELGYLSYLCRREADAWKNGDRKGAIDFLRMEEQFLREHLARWVPRLCQELIKSDGSGFYRAVATMTEEFILTDSDDLRKQLSAYDDQPS